MIGVDDRRSARVSDSPDVLSALEQRRDGGRSGGGGGDDDDRR